MSLPRPVSLLFFFRSHLVSGPLWLLVNLFVTSILILHDVKKKSILTSSSAAYFCHFPTAWQLTAFHARTMLFWRRDSCYHSLVTYIYILLGDVYLFLNT